MARPKRQAAQNARLKLSHVLEAEGEASSATAHVSNSKASGEADDTMPDSGSYLEEPISERGDSSDSDSGSAVISKKSKPSRSKPIKAVENVPKIRKKTEFKRKAAASPNDASVRFGRRRHADGGKEANIISLLGNHVSMSEALIRKQEWAVEMLGPRLSLIRKYFGDGNSLPKASDLGMDVQRSTSLKHSSPIVVAAQRESPIKVQFVKAEDRSLNRKLMSRHDVHNPASSGSKCNSLTICTGIVNNTVAWLPILGDVQYLAVAGKAHQEEPIPLFQLQAGPGCVQIWQVTTHGTQDATIYATIYHNYGVTWQLRWCPALSDGERLGLLAGVFGDGSLRLFHVYKHTNSSKHHVEQLDQPAHTFTLPDSHVVTFDWLDHTRIAAGCANGMLIVWDIAGDMKYPMSTGILHSTFINNIVSCGPTAQDVVLTTSWDCNVKMSNIWNPEVEFVAATRERMTVYAAAWSDFINCAIVNDDLRSFRMVSMRGGFSATLGSMDGTVTALATNEKHPFLAAGDASGAVTIVNVCRKAMMKKLDQFRRRVYQLDWSMKEDEYRFTENFYIDELLGKTATAKNIATNIYPQEVKVTALAWNPNAGFEGLLASSTTNFVRIDNLGVQ